MNTIPLAIQMNEVAKKGQGRHFVGLRSIWFRIKFGIKRKFLNLFSWFFPRNPDIVHVKMKFIFTEEGKFTRVVDFPTDENTQIAVLIEADNC